MAIIMRYGSQGNSTAGQENSIIASGLIAIMLLFIDRFVDHITPRGWFEYYRSFTIPYIILAGFYYYRVFSETKAQNALIKELQNQIEE